MVKYRLNLTTVVLIVLLVLFSLVHTAVASGLGSLISEKLVGMGSVSNSNRLIAREGVSSPTLDIGMGPSVSTLGATGVVFEIGHTAATLNGNLVSHNGFSSSDVWFEWGYSPSSLTSSTPIQVGVILGGYSATISGYAPGTVYYRFVGCSDGTSYGSTYSFISGGATWLSFTMTQTVLLIWVGIVILAVLAGVYSGMPVIPVLIVGAILAILGVAGVEAIMGAFRGWWG